MRPHTTLPLLVLLPLLGALLLGACAGAAEHGYAGGLSAPPATSEPQTPNQPQQPVPDAPQTGRNYVREQADAILADLLTPDMEDAEKILAAYRYIMEHTTFAEPVGLDVWRWRSTQTTLPTYVENRALSPLVFGIGSCEDYAAALTVLLEQMGFAAQYVAGYTISVDGVYVDHAWTLVELDGNWYHLDSQLEQNVVRGGVTHYRYFLKTDEEMLADHKWGENLIAYWPGLSQRDAANIRARYTVPACNTRYPARAPEALTLPPKPDMAAIALQLEQERTAAALQPLDMHTRPPVLLHPDAPQTRQYGRSFLTDTEQALYDSLYLAALDYDLFAELPVPHGLSEARLEQMVQYFWSDNPQFYWVQPYLQTRNAARSLRLRVTDGLTLAQVMERNAEIDKAVQSILAHRAGDDAFALSTYVHDYLAANVRYDTSAQKPDIRNVYGALIKGEAVCDGYAAAYQLLLERAGIDCIFMQGNSFRGIPHSWNAVQLDGLWYYTDVTWDAPNENQPFVSHAYLHVPRALFEQEHYWDTAQFPSLPQPDATTSGYFPLHRRAVTPGAGQDINSLLAEAFVNELASLPAPSGTETAQLEILVQCSAKDFAKIKDGFVRDLFPILENMDALARQRGLPLRVETQGKIACNFNEGMQTLVLYPVVHAA